MTLARAATRIFSDPELAAATLRSGAAKYKVLGRGAYHFESTVVELDRLTLQWEVNASDASCTTQRDDRDHGRPLGRLGPVHARG